MNTGGNYIPINAILRSKTVERFKRKLQPVGECLEYQGTRNARGYGVVEIMWHGIRFSILAHRFSWATSNQRDPENGLIICHKCNNPPCCNPDHLYAGTHFDNLMDRYRAEGRIV